MKRLSILLLCAVCAAISSFAQVPTYSVYEDCSRNGYATAPAPADVQMVDLGLSVKWATCNVGATAPEEYGNYYAWGEVLPKDDYSLETYKHCDGTSSSMTKYCTNSSYGTVDNKTTLEATDDAATHNWGGNWRMPTEAEWQELKEGCTLTITTLNGVYGYEIKSSINGNTIFLPAAGYFRSQSNTQEGSRGSYWSSSLSESDNTYAWDCYLNTGRTIRTDTRNTGRSIRPVCPAGSSTNSAAHHTLTLYADGCGNANTIVLLQGTQVKIQAVPEDFHHFVQWNDGNTDNPRTVLLTKDTTLTAEFDLAYSGMCGDNLYWEYKDKVLTITGSGAMYDYAYNIYESENVEIMPWLYLRDSIYSVILPNGITYIGNWAFNGCYNLRDITCLAVTPPTCGSNAFDYVPDNATLWCPCESKEAYQAADGWSRFNDIRRINFPQTTLLTDSDRGRAQIDEWICESQSVVISATPNVGYSFTRWSDGNTDNPRTVRLTQDITLTAEFGLAYSGMCGDNLYWEYKDKKLIITGSGEMYDGTPWWLLCDSIYSVSLPNGITYIGRRAFSGCYNLVSITIPNTVTYIGNRAFADCSALPSITLPNSITSIAYRTFSGCTSLASVIIPGSVTFIDEYAFEECRKLRDIYCYAATPPTAQTYSFANYNVYVHVPCASLDAYDMDVVFGSFKYVECIGSEDADITDKTVTVVPGNVDATFTWPITDGAETYTLVITKDGVTFCTLVFNKQGQLVSIAFKPARQNAPATEGTTPTNYAEQTANGFRFTVTNLSEGTAYAYTLTVRNAANSILETYTGEFTTQSDMPMGLLESVPTGRDAPGQAEKILRDGQVLILRNGETYDMMGQQL